MKQEKYCKCGCGESIKPKQTWVQGHHLKGKDPHNKGTGKKVELTPCGCGCGELVQGKFKLGHGARVNHWSKSMDVDDIRQKISKAASERTGDKHWRTGKTKKDYPAFSNSGVPKGTIPWNKGMGEYLSAESRERVKDGSRGLEPWNKGKHGCYSEETLAKISRKDKPHTEESKEKCRQSQLERYKDPKEREKTSKAGLGKTKPDSMKQKVSERMKTSENPWYIDGRASGENQPYPDEFHEKRLNIVKRDGIKCKLCESYGILSVHHIDYNKDNNHWLNLITLCKSCHGKTNPKSRRNYYKQLLNNLLLRDIPLEMRFIGKQQAAMSA